MKQRLQVIVEKWKLAILVLGHLFATLALSRRIVRRARPVFYVADGLLACCAFVTALWIV
ncbi:hypothetical protein [Desulfopila sp. IMCC35008]|uniref:hypothetical protein n=1 Tax=Desulfopila sp. IMCC35008 TaxID=2653858 RepID=UPI0013D718F0|nr:hypothetical protein [Desulfopila sp. IMCC35008]